MSNPESDLLNAIDEEFLLATLEELVELRTVGPNEDPGQEYLAAVLTKLGAETDVWEIDFESLRKHPSFSMEVERSAALGVVGIFGEDDDGPSLILNGHIDVVPPGDENRWTSSPWRATRRDDRIYGLGTCDMKGGLACILTAVKAVTDSGTKLKGKLLVESVVGEEDGGCGTLAAIERGYRADGALIAEPTDLRVGPASAGALSFRLSISGKSAHACVREEGVSAVEKFELIHRALLELEAERNARAMHPLYRRYRLPYALSIGTVTSGNWPSSVPESLVCEGRYGVAPGEDLEDARREFEETLSRATEQDRWLRDNPPALEWWGGQFAPGSISETHPLVETVKRSAAEVTGNESIVEGMPYGADLRLLVNDGDTPAVLFGPGDVRNAHSPDEFVPLSDLQLAAHSIALTALRFCGT